MDCPFKCIGPTLYSGQYVSTSVSLFDMWARRVSAFLMIRGTTREPLIDLHQLWETIISCEVLQEVTEAQNNLRS